MNKFKQIKIDYHFKVKLIASTKNKTWDEAQAWAKEQGGRVPTVSELQMLCTLQRIGKLDTEFSGWFWSSEEHFGVLRNTARMVGFYDGYVDYDLKGSQFQVICIKDM